MRNNLKTKIITALLASALITATFTGCTSDGDKSSSSAVEGSKAESSSQSSEEDDAKPMSIKWLSFYGPETNDTYPQKFLEEKYNVKIDNVIIDRNLWNEQLNVKLASGDIPDLFWSWGAGDVVKYKEQGVLAKVPRELVEEKMPSLTSAINELEPRLWFNSMVGDENYGVPLYWANGVVPQSPVYNKAWLEKIGATVPKTLDEYINVLTKFANEDPDANGKKDTYGISFRGKDALGQTMMNIFWAHGVGVADNIENSAKDGVVMSFMTDEWKDAATVVQKLYKDGVIDPESITDDNAQLTQKFANQRTGVLENGNWYHWLPEIGGYRIAADAAGVDVEYGHLPVKEEYSRTSNVISGGVNNSIVAMGIQVEKEPEKMNKMLEIMEDLHGDKDTFIATVFGKEGDHFNVVDGAIIRDPKVGDMIMQGTKFGVGTFYGMFGSAKSLPMAEYDYAPEQLKVKEQFLQDTTVKMPMYIGSLPSSGKYPDLNNMVNENLVKFFIGELNFEKDLEDFRAKWLASGGEVLTKEANELYQSQLGQ